MVFTCQGLHLFIGNLRSKISILHRLISLGQQWKSILVWKYDLIFRSSSIPISSDWQGIGTPLSYCTLALDIWTTNWHAKGPLSYLLLARLIPTPWKAFWLDTNRLTWGESKNARWYDESITFEKPGAIDISRLTKFMVVSKRFVDI